MKAFAHAAVAFLVGAAFAAIAVLVLRGVTEPAGTIFGVPNRIAMIGAWWCCFVGVPAVTTVDLVVRPQEDWWAARRSKTAWLALIWSLPFFGPMGYVAVVRPRVAGAYRRTLNLF
jgi:hypothetical protein